MEDEPDPTPHFDAAGRLVAPRYDDLYFSIADGLAETTHVFLDGNDLGPRFAALGAGDTFTVGETGFGTGLNFLACWRRFASCAPAGARLRFVTVEKEPLSPETICRALAPWPELAPELDALLEQYAPGGPGVHRVLLAGGRVELVLLIGEAAEVLADESAPMDAWFLDGFAPARNPAMWSDDVFKHVARLSTTGTTLATYTVAGAVRRGLAVVGFEVAKRPGFGTKRDMAAGRFVGPQAAPARSENSQRIGVDVLVIGAGLAGSFAASALAERGLRVTVVERQAMAGGAPAALRPRVALLQPKINDQNDPPGARLREGFSLARQIVTDHSANDARIRWSPCGAFHAAYDARSTKRLRRFVDQFGETGLCRWIDASQTREETGLALEVDGVIIDAAGTLRPAGLCAALLGCPGITLQDACEVAALEQTPGGWCAACKDGRKIEAGRVVVASAMDAARLAPTAHLDLRPVRGQVSLISQQASEQCAGLGDLRRALCFGGYFTPAIDGRHTLGASFVPGDTDTSWRDQEHRAVCDRLARIVPTCADELRDSLDAMGWAGIRCTTPTRSPYAGPVERDGVTILGLYASLGHGSHGICSAAISAQHVAEKVIDPHAEG